RGNSTGSPGGAPSRPQIWSLRQWPICAARRPIVVRVGLSRGWISTFAGALFRFPCGGIHALRMLARLALIAVLLAAVLAVPFALRPRVADGPQGRTTPERLVVITPHIESIQAEFGRAFRAHLRREQGREVEIDWRQPGGTSEIALYLRSEYATRFETRWREQTGLPFSQAIREAFLDARWDERAKEAEALLSSGEWEQADPERLAVAARRLFLQSEIGA